jgi:cytochrome P450
MTQTGQDMRVQELPYIDFQSENYKNDPQSVLDAARDECEFARSFRGVEILSYEAASEMLRNSGFWAAREKSVAASGFTEGPVYDSMTRLIVNIEGVDHQRQRKAVYRWFTPRKVGEWRTMIRGWSSEWLDEASNAGSVDIFGGLTRRLPATLFCWIVGAPLEDADRVAAWSDGLLATVSFTPETAALLQGAHDEAVPYLQDLIAEKRRLPGDDLISALIESEKQGQLSEREMVDLSLSILTGSTDTTNTQMCLNFRALSTLPDEWRSLKKDTELVPQAVRELMRFAPGMLSTSRSPYDTTTQFRDLEIDHSQFYFTNFEAANKDPKVFSAPNTFDLRRESPSPALNFGTGRHGCLGQALSMVEQEEVLRVALDRWESFETRDAVFEGAPFMWFARAMTIDFE